MEKKQYEEVEMEVVEFEAADVIDESTEEVDVE